jgi:hypothetical protein
LRTTSSRIDRVAIFVVLVFLPFLLRVKFSVTAQNDFRNVEIDACPSRRVAIYASAHLALDSDNLARSNGSPVIASWVPAKSKVAVPI